jgi:hypothetical protein
MEVFVLSTITRFSVRSSGRDVSVVRRPDAASMVRKSGLADPASLKKAELVAMAEAQGVDPSGTKADLVERLTEPTDG